VNVQIRCYDHGDASTLFEIFVEAVREGTAAHYTPAQRHAWAPETTMPPGWPDKLAGLDTRVAVAGGEIAGFMAATQKGYVDLAFVRPLWMGRGVAQALHDCLVERARGRGLTRLSTHASHPARSFFARNGWRVEATEIIDRNGEALTRFAMSLELGEPP
jgi:putative acetyltransferase